MRLISLHLSLKPAVLGQLLDRGGILVRPTVPMRTRLQESIHLQQQPLDCVVELA